MATQACVFNICFPVPAGLGSLIPGATAPASPSTTATAASPTSNVAVATTVAASTIVSAGQTIVAPASTVTSAAGLGATVTQTLVRTVTVPAASSAAANGLPSIPSGLVLPDNFQLPPGFQLPPKPKYQFDVDARLSDAVIYAILLFPTLYLLWKHGRRGWLVWPAMAAFCIIEIARDALFMWPGGSLLKIGTGWIVTSAITLILLVMFPVGLNYEASAYIPTTSRGKRILILAASAFIGLLGLILGTIGAVPLSLTAQIRNKPYNLRMARAGYILLLLLLILTWLHSLALTLRTTRTSRATTAPAQRSRTRALLLGSLVATPLIAIRVGRSVHYSFAYRPTLNPINGSFVTIFVFVWLMQLLAFLAILTAGFVALRINPHHHHHHHRARAGEAAAAVVPPRARDAEMLDAAADSDDVEDVKAEQAEQEAERLRLAQRGALPVGRRHVFSRRRHDGAAATGAGAGDMPGAEYAGRDDAGYFVPEKQRAVREV